MISSASRSGSCAMKACPQCLKYSTLQSGQWTASRLVFSGWITASSVPPAARTGREEPSSRRGGLPGVPGCLSPFAALQRRRRELGSRRGHSVAEVAVEISRHRGREEKLDQPRRLLARGPRVVGQPRPGLRARRHGRRRRQGRWRAGPAPRPVRRPRGQRLGDEAAHRPAGDRQRARSASASSRASRSAAIASIVSGSSGSPSVDSPMPRLSGQITSNERPSAARKGGSQSAAVAA